MNKKVVLIGAGIVVVLCLCVVVVVVAAGALGYGHSISTPAVAQSVTRTQVPTVASTSTPTPTSEAVFATPEEAITHYFEGVTQSDSRQILEACAIDEMAAHFQLDKETERLGNVFLPSTSLAPTDYPLDVEINKVQLSAQILNRVKLFSYGLLSGENMENGSPLTNMDAGRVSRFVKAVDPQRLAALQIQQIAPSNEKVMTDTKYLDSAARIAHSYGADEYTERLALLLFEKNYYGVGFTLLRYGEQWKISSQVSPIAATNSLGVPQKTTVDAFGHLVSGY